MLTLTVGVHFKIEHLTYIKKHDYIGRAALFSLELQINMRLL